MESKTFNKDKQAAILLYTTFAFALNFIATLEDYTNVRTKNIALNALETAIIYSQCDSKTAKKVSYKTVKCLIRAILGSSNKYKKYKKYTKRVEKTYIKMVRVYGYFNHVVILDFMLI